MRSLSYTKLDVSVLVQIAKVTLKALKPLERNVRGYLDETRSRKRSKSAG
jgi:lysyl-tRNA synthetase class II